MNRCQALDSYELRIYDSVYRYPIFKSMFASISVFIFHFATGNTIPISKHIFNQTSFMVSFSTNFVLCVVVYFQKINLFPQIKTGIENKPFPNYFLNENNTDEQTPFRQTYLMNLFPTYWLFCVVVYFHLKLKHYFKHIPTKQIKANGNIVVAIRIYFRKHNKDP